MKKTGSLAMQLPNISTTQEEDQATRNPTQRPVSEPNDPVTWPKSQRIYLALLAATLVFSAQLGASMINPAYLPMSADLHISIEQASYSTTVYILFGGLTPLLIVPFANVYGRRPFFVLFALLAAVGQYVSAAAPTYAGVMAGRATLCVLLFLTLPETLSSPRCGNAQPSTRVYTQKLLFPRKVVDRPMRTADFTSSFRMIKYCAVLLPSIWYMTANTYGSTLFAVTSASLASQTYSLDLQSTGLYMGVPLTIGSLIGEAMAGWVSDGLLNAYAQRHGGHRKAEVRLYILPLTLLLGIGTAVYGYCISSHQRWIVAAVAMAVAGVGTQVGTKMVYTYATDAYKAQAAQVGAVINLFKSVSAFNIGFYALPFGARVGFAAAFGTLAGVNLLLLVPLGVLMWKGEEIRRWQGQPHEDDEC